MRRLRFYIDITVNTHKQDEYAWCACVLEDAIKRTTSSNAEDAFYLGNAKVLRKQPRRPPQ